MLLVLAIVLALVWIFGFAVYHVASAAIHLLLVLAVLSAALYLVGRGRRTAAT